MSSTATFIPGTHCVLCLQTDRGRVAATCSVPKGAGPYQTCELHFDVVERCATIADAIREVKRCKAIGGAV